MEDTRISNIMEDKLVSARDLLKTWCAENCRPTPFCYAEGCLIYDALKRASAIKTQEKEAQE